LSLCKSMTVATHGTDLIAGYIEKTYFANALMSRLELELYNWA